MDVSAIEDAFPTSRPRRLDFNFFLIRFERVEQKKTTTKNKRKEYKTRLEEGRNPDERKRVLGSR